MAYVSVTALKYLSDKLQEKGELHDDWVLMEKYYNKKLWHQTTLLLLKMVKHASMTQNGELVKLYHDFVSDFESRINTISLVEIAGRVADQIDSPEEAVGFLQKIETKVKNQKEAVVLCRVLQGCVQLHKASDLVATKSLLEDLEPMVEDLNSVTFTHGRFYRLASDYHKAVGEHAEYFRCALRFLGCTDLEELTLAEKQERAFFLGLAALLGVGIYNFGELLAHPILQSLVGTQHQWLIRLLTAFNCGDLSTFEQLKPEWGGQADLFAKREHLLEKIQLLALMEMAFRRPSHGRCLTFAEVAAATRLDETQVERHVMRALSLNLVRGYMDEVDRTVQLDWVQPRVLDKSQLASMIERLDLWCRDVQSMELLLEQKAQDILTL